jgi:hypothetical protein
MEWVCKMWTPVTLPTIPHVIFYHGQIWIEDAAWLGLSKNDVAYTHICRARHFHVDIHVLDLFSLTEFWPNPILLGWFRWIIVPVYQTPMPSPNTRGPHLLLQNSDPIPLTKCNLRFCSLLFTINCLIHDQSAFYHMPFWRHVVIIWQLKL